MTDVTLDAGGLIALDWDDRRMVVVLMARARETAARVVVSASALAQAIRRPDRQVRLVQLVRPRGHLRAPCLGSPWSSVRLELTRFRDAAGQQFHRQPRLPLDQLHDRWRHRRADAGVVGDCGHWKGTASPRAPDIAAWLRGVAGLLIWSFIPFPVSLGLLRRHISAIIDERFAAAGGGGMMARMLTQVPLPLLPHDAAEIAPGVGVVSRPGRRRRGVGARAGHVRVGCRR